MAAEKALERRMAKAKQQQDPMALIHEALALADDPKLPISYETRMAIIEPLLRAKHFGPGGGLKGGQTNQSQAPQQQPLQSQPQAPTQNPGAPVNG